MQYLLQNLKPNSETKTYFTREVLNWKLVISNHYFDKLLSSSLIMTEVRSKRHALLPLVFTLNCVKKPLFIIKMVSRKEIRFHARFAYKCQRFLVLQFRHGI